jgi:hypothetical protein
MNPLKAPPGRAEVVAAYLDGVAAVARVAAGITGSAFTGAGWAARSPCRLWTAADVAGHLRCVAGYHTRFRDDVLAGRRHLVDEHLGPGGGGVPALSAALARLNASTLAVLPPAAPEAHLKVFAATATAYAERLPEVWDTPAYRTSPGSGWVTLGQHAGAAVAEWHLHAWDLARSAGLDHRPDDPDLLAEIRLPALAHQPLPPGPAWDAILHASGRDPTWK